MKYKEREFKYVIYENDYGTHQTMYEFSSFKEAIDKLDKLNNKMEKFEGSKDYDDCDEYGELRIVLEEQSYILIKDNKRIFMDKEFDLEHISKHWIDIIKEIDKEDKKYEDKTN